MNGRYLKTLFACICIFTGFAKGDLKILKDIGNNAKVIRVFFSSGDFDAANKFIEVSYDGITKKMISEWVEPQKTDDDAKRKKILGECKTNIGDLYFKDKGWHIRNAVDEVATRSMCLELLRCYYAYEMYLEADSLLLLLDSTEIL